jgi:adenine-specific DNA-methyltransferase
MPRPGNQQSVLNILENLKGLDPLKELFWTELHYDRINEAVSRRGWNEQAAKALAEDPVVFAGGGENSDFKVILARLDSEKVPLGMQRPVINRLLQDFPYALFVFSNRDRSQWHFVNVKYDAEASRRRLFRRISVQPGDGLRTATERLQMLDLASFGRDLFGISALEIQKRHDEAFDVEKVTKDFYNEIANWYFWAREHALFPKDAPLDSDGKPSLPLIRLLTRLIFCWFLREKRNPQTGEGLIPDDLFLPQRISQLLKDPSPDSFTYYTAILQNLFFATLNTEMDKPGQRPTRHFVDEGDGQRSDEHMVHQLWRHTRQLRDASALEKLLRNIPFLNGGLFECLDERVQKGNSAFTAEVRIDGFSSDPNKQPKVPNFLFYGAPQKVDLSAAYGDSSKRHERVAPLLDILRRYRFTLTENTPLDQEVALDPELLGHVFENLLAAYNPETGTVARNATGSFYTPRVVVDWMVDQALLVYLGQKLDRAIKSATKKKTDKRLETLLSWEESEHDFNAREIDILIDDIDHLKALDPACGSGAFPMGLLQKLVHVLRKLDPENKRWRRRQEDALDTFESAPAREEAREAIKRAFARDNDDYGRKLYLIENCLYGVDIQPIACQIAKLRFFISLIVDQSIDPKEPNYGILPLPNLETKVVAANTLLGLQRGQLLLGSDKVRRLEKELQQIRHDYFTARRYKDKKALRARDKELCSQLAKALTESGECSSYDANRLAEWNPYDTNKDASFFDPAWMFGLPIPSQDNTGVFDIVLGNPPYVRQEVLKDIVVAGSDGKPRGLKEALKDRYECYTGTADLYVYFFERSLQLLRKGGVLSFITNNKYMRAAYGERLRTYLFYSTHPRVILDFGDADLFTSVAYPCILVTEKVRQVDKGSLPDAKQFSLPQRVKQLLDDPDRNIRVLVWQVGQEFSNFPAIFEAQASHLTQRNLKPAGWRLQSPVRLRLLEKFHQIGEPLGKHVRQKIYFGIKTGLNEAFVVDRDTRDQLIARHESSAQILKPFLRGRDVKRWRVKFANQYLIRLESSENVKHTWSDKAPKEAEKIFAKAYPAIHDFFEPVRKELIKRYDQGQYFWELRSCDYWGAFAKSKLLYPDIYEHQSFAWDESGYHLANTCYFISTTEKWLLPLLNSTSVEWFYGNTANRIRGGYLRAFTQFMTQIPVPPATAEEKRLCEQLANALIWLHQQDGSKSVESSAGLMSAYFEQWLNGLVYELFFRDELHARKLKLFDETAKLNPPELDKLSATDRMSRLRAKSAD